MLLIAAAVLFGSYFLRAGEPILTLTTATLDFPYHRTTSTSERGTTRTAAFSKSEDDTPPAPTIQPLATEAAFLSTELLLQKPFHDSANLFLLTREDSAVSHGGLWGSARLQAGYGQIFFDQIEKTYCPSGTGMQEPGCGYLKIRFSF